MTLSVCLLKFIFPLNAMLKQYIKIKIKKRKKDADFSYQFREKNVTCILAKVSNISLGTREKCPVQCQGQGPAEVNGLLAASVGILQLAPCV